jgi:hypothetical protein
MESSYSHKLFLYVELNIKTYEKLADNNVDGLKT